MSFFYVYFQTKKRVRQDLSQAQTVNAGLLLDTAENKNDESILLHIRGVNLAAAEARYHRNCYYNYTKDFSNMLANRSKNKNSNDENLETKSLLSNFASMLLKNVSFQAKKYLL